jgi:cation diffusion facilitator CzcD-associated flavoprotein CzcO
LVLDVAVIGAGQAGLTIGYFLAQQGRQFVILERAGSIGAAWRERWDSLTLFTPRRYNSLPGQPFPGDPDGYPNRDEVISYLESYAKAFDLPVELNSPVLRLTAEDDRFLIVIEGKIVEAEQVVVATGPFQTPYVPEVAGRLAPDVVQMHATGYRNPSDISEGSVLVVGGGNTGFQIAKELSNRPDYSWIHLPILDERGRLRHRRGVTDVAGLYFLGLTWQHTRGSALMGWVKDDAAFIAEKIAKSQERPREPAVMRQTERV